MNNWRGHAIELGDHGIWYYVDTKRPVFQKPDRDCGHCGKANTCEGHDGCLGTLPGVINACCGHGDVERAYVVLDTGERLSGQEALDWVEQVKS